MKLQQYRFVFYFLMATTLAACGAPRFDIIQSAPGSNNNKTQEPANPGPPQVPSFEPLLWEPFQKSGRLWSEFVYRLLSHEAKSIVEKNDDMDVFCPRYFHLTQQQQINVTALFISAIAKFESEFDPLSRMKESNLGQDPITGNAVYSEGLLQLSYQDQIGRPFCHFDWTKDQRLSVTDPRKTILNPYINLECGVRILAEQVDKYGSLIIEHGDYWAVIRKNGKFQKIREISRLVQTLSYCR